MKQLITKEDVGKAINQLVGQGKKPTLVALHAVLDHKGSMSTLVRLKAEIEAEAQRPTDSPEALEAFREVWALAHAEGRTEQTEAVAELRDSLQALAAENERLEGLTAAAQKRASDLAEATAKAETELQVLRINAERDLSRAASTMRDAGLQAAKALQELADARGAHAAQVTALQADLNTVQRNAHEFELQLVRAHALLEAKGLASEKLQTSESAGFTNNHE
jgi:chromosome segregation ATPase